MSLIIVGKCIRKFRAIIRTTWYRCFYGVKVGKKTLFSGPAEIISQGNTTVGDNCVICPWVVFREWGGYITIGDNCTINSFSHLSGNGGIEIGNNVRIATQCVIISANHNFDRIDVPITQQGETRGKIIIEDDCWLGAGVKVLSGVTIGAGAVVTKNIPPYSIAVGVPAKVIKSRLPKGESE